MSWARWRPACVVLGGGGHARMVLDAVLLGGHARPVAVLDRDASRWGQELFGVPVRGGDELLPQLRAGGVTHFIMGLGAVGDNGPRRRLFEQAGAQGLIPLTVVHPSAVCSPRARLGPGTVVGPAAVVNAGAVVGANVIVNTGALIEHDCVIGDHAHVATGARLGGAVRIGEAAHIGAGATVREGMTIGVGALVGAGAVVVRDVEPRSIVVGVPARSIRRVDNTGDRTEASEVKANA